MKIKLVDYLTDPQKVQTGTCELCFGIDTDMNQQFVFRDETGKEFIVDGTWWDWGDKFEIDIDNILQFSDWVENKVFPDDIAETADYSWLEELSYEFEEYEHKDDRK